MNWNEFKDNIDKQIVEMNDKSDTPQDISEMTIHYIDIAWALGTVHLDGNVVQIR